MHCFVPVTRYLVPFAICFCVLSAFALDDSYYIFDTHFHSIKENYLNAYQDMISCESACDTTAFTFDHCENLFQIYHHFLQLRDANIRRILLVEGPFARRSDWSLLSGLCEDYSQAASTPSVYYHFTGEAPDRGSPDERKKYYVDRDYSVAGLLCRKALDDNSVFFPALIGLSMDHCSTIDEAWDQLSPLYPNPTHYAWVGEMLQEPCFKSYLEGCPVDGDPSACSHSGGWCTCNELNCCMLHPYPNMENLFDACAAAGIPISTHLPFVDGHSWNNFIDNGYECPLDDLSCRRFVNILQAAADAGSTEDTGVDIHYNMSGTQFFNLDPASHSSFFLSLIDAYRYLFDTYPNFYLEMQYIVKCDPYGPGSLPPRKYDWQDVTKTYFLEDEITLNPLYKPLIALFYDYSDHFTICSHMYPGEDFSPDSDSAAYHEGQFIDPGGNPVSGEITGMYCLNQNDIVAVTANGGLWAFNGSIWMEIDHESNATFNDVCVIQRMHRNDGVTEIFAAGHVTNGIVKLPRVYYWIRSKDGQYHQQSTFMFKDSGFSFRSVDGIYRYDSSQMHDNTAIYVAGGPKIYEFSGNKWTEVPNLTGLINPDYYCVYTGSDFVLLAGEQGSLNSRTGFGIAKQNGLWKSAILPISTSPSRLYCIDGSNNSKMVLACGKSQNHGVLYEADFTQWRPVFESRFVSEISNSCFFTINSTARRYAFVAGKAGEIIWNSHSDGADNVEKTVWKKFDSTPVTTDILCSSGIGQYNYAGTKDGKIIRHESDIRMTPFHEYWDEFFRAIREYAKLVGDPTKGYSQIQNITHCNAERIGGFNPLRGYDCDHPHRNETRLESTMTVSKESVLDYNDASVTLVEGSSIVCPGGDLTIIVGGDLLIEKNALIDVSSAAGSVGGRLFLDVGGKLILGGSILAEGSKDEASSNGSSGGSIRIVSDRTIIYRSGVISASCLADDSLGGEISIDSRHVLNDGTIQTDNFGLFSGSALPVAGNIHITSNSGHTLNFGLISASVIYSPDGNAGNISIETDQELINTGIISCTMASESAALKSQTNAGTILLVSLNASIRNEGQIQSVSKVWQGGAGGTIDLLSVTGNIENSGVISADSMGIISKGTTPAAGFIRVIADDIYHNSGKLAASCINLENKEADSHIEVSYGRILK